MNKEQLENMSDLLINEKVALEQGLLVATDDHQVYARGYREKYPSTIWVAKHIKGDQSEPWEQVNYCAEPSDMMPLVFERGISLSPIQPYTEEHDPSLWCASCDVDNGNVECWHANPLRAAAIVYLLMESKK